jgi:3-phenylpropionate/trans-cinnamate dioxygenase ferredoxin subunit
VTAIDVGAAQDFSEGVIRIVRFQSRDIGVLRWRGHWFALRNVCPHLGAPICTGPVQSFYTEESAWSHDLAVDSTRPVLTCPWHHWSFDLRTGLSIFGHERVKTYGVEIRQSRVMILVS